MGEIPGWLPDRLHYSGDWEGLLENAYAIFERDLKQPPRPTVDGYAVLHDSRFLDSDKEEGFWHVTSSYDHDTGKRLPDVDRLCHVPWIRAIIENVGAPEVCKFDYVEKGDKTRTYLWLKELDYVVILEKKRRVAFLVTAFVIKFEGKRRELQKKLEKASP